MKQNVIDRILGTEDLRIDKKGQVNIMSLTEERIARGINDPDNFNEWVKGKLGYEDTIYSTYPMVPFPMAVEYICSTSSGLRGFITDAIAAFDHCHLTDIVTGKQNRTREEARKLLMVYFERKVDVSDFAPGMSQVDFPTILEMVKAVMLGEDYDVINSSILVYILSTKHIKVDKKYRGVYLQTNGDTVEKVITNKRFQIPGILTRKDYRDAILSLNGTFRAKSPVRIGSKMSRAVFIPAELLFFGDDDVIVNPKAKDDGDIDEIFGPR